MTTQNIRNAAAAIIAECDILDGQTTLPPTATTGQFIEIFGTIRMVNGTWTVLDNADHKPLNILSVAAVNGGQASGYVRVTFPTASKVGTFIAVPDETCVKVGINAGSSVGLGEALISFSEKGVPIAPNSIANPSANFWLYGKMWA